VPETLELAGRGPADSSRGLSATRVVGVIIPQPSEFFWPLAANRNDNHARSFFGPLQHLL